MAYIDENLILNYKSEFEGAVGRIAI